MFISVVNHTTGRISDEDLLAAIRAINRQLAEDFEPHWSFGATLRMEGRSRKKPNTATMLDLRGDAIIYLWDKINVSDALGYHERNARGIPYGFVFTDLSDELEENWTVTLSHEVLELVGDPECNLLVMGPHPKKKRRNVFHWFEMCDAVQDETYEIDGIEVSNFVLPLFFTGSNERGGRNDFLGRRHKGGPLKSFGINPGGYIGFFDHKTGKHQTVYRDDDEVAARRMRIKAKAKGARRSVRYRRFQHAAHAAKLPVGMRPPGSARPTGV